MNERRCSTKFKIGKGEKVHEVRSIGNGADDAIGMYRSGSDGSRNLQH